MTEEQKRLTLIVSKFLRTRNPTKEQRLAAGAAFADLGDLVRGIQHEQCVGSQVDETQLDTFPWIERKT